MITDYQSIVIFDIPFELKEKFNRLENEFYKKRHLDLDRACEILDFTYEGTYSPIISYLTIHINNECTMALTGHEYSIVRFLKQLSEHVRIKDYSISSTIQEFRKKTVSNDGFGVVRSKVQMIFKFNKSFDRETIHKAGDWVNKLYDLFNFSVGTQVILDFKNEDELGEFLKMIGLTLNEAKQIQSLTTKDFYCMFNFPIEKPFENYIQDTLEYTEEEL